MKETYRKDTYLLGPLQRHVMRKANQVSPGDIERRSDIMHPSELSKAEWCGRHDYYRIIGMEQEKVSEANPSFTMANILTEGTNIHTKYQTWLWEMDVLRGWWRCNDCKHYWEDISPTSCLECGSSGIRYVEVPLLDNFMMVGGHADGAVHGLLDYPFLIEVKSIGIRTLAFEAPRLYEQYQSGVPAEEIWFQINRPFGSHLRQGTWYLWLAERMGLPYKRMLFIYESKFNQQVKEFNVKYNPRLIEDRLADAKDVAQGVRASVAPDRPPWAAPEGPICQNCTYRRTCWEGHVTDHQAKPEPLRIIKTSTRRRKRVLGEA